MTSPIPTDLADELEIAARDLRAQRTFLKDSVESTTGFSFDALAHLYDTSRATIEHLQSQLTAAPKEGSYFVAMREASARIQHLEKALAEAESEARRFAEFYPVGSDGRNTFVIFADKIAALKTVEQGE